jgi:putative addiction module component (TIGR02574 family)
MAKNASDLFQEALALPPEARAALADSLLHSLEPPSDERAEALWRVEIRKRIAQIESGAVEMTPWPDVRARLDRYLQTVE